MIASRSWRGSLFTAALTLCFGAALVTTMTLPGRAQDETPMPAQQAEAPAPEANPVAAAITATGCLARNDDGVFQLKAEDAVYTLTPASEDVDLSSHVGHTITVNGPATPAADDAAADAPQALSVASLKMEAETCTPAAAPAEVPAEAPPADAPAPAEAPPAPPE
ncbi:MAG TPA: hypothetical protein VNE83_05510 [Terriglobales bacterium]|nr:hypothetical protein [Terriglobales bacterium]